MQIICIDDFFKEEFDPSDVRNFGLSQFKNSNLVTDGSVGYPGTRRNISPDSTLHQYIKEKISEPVSILCEYEKIKQKKVNCVQMQFHLTTSIHEQGLVHTDDPEWIAGVIYLNKKSPKNTGTKIYTKKKLYENVKNLTAPNHFRKAFSTGNEDLIKNFAISKKYYNERYYKEERNIQNVFNSAIIYPGKYNHSPDQYFGETLKNSRFVIVFFANCSENIF